MGWNRDIVVVGASAGGIKALKQFVRGLPERVPAAIFVVMHTSPSHKSLLPEILSRVDGIQAVHAVDGWEVREGTIYVAPPDRHLLLEQNRMRVVFGPRENLFRPAIDPLFRSAAGVYGARVAGILLSGTLDDGCNGLADIRHAGGLSLVQDPEEAEFPQLPKNALQKGHVDRIVSASKMGELLSGAVQEILRTEDQPVDAKQSQMVFSGITCPECHGPIMSVPGENFRFECIVGHCYSPEAMRVEHGRRVENALWSAVAGLKEHATILRQIAARYPVAGGLPAVDRYTAEADQQEKFAAELRGLIERISTPELM